MSRHLSRSFEFDCDFAVTFFVTESGYDYGVDWEDVCRRYDALVGNSSVWADVFTEEIIKVRIPLESNSTVPPTDHPVAGPQTRPTVNPLFLLVSFVIYTYVMFFVCLTGLVANALVALVFSQTKRITPTTQLLLALAVVDELHLLGKIIIPGLMLTGQIAGVPREAPVNMFILVVQYTTDVMEIGLLMVITTERVIMASWPLKARGWITRKRTRWSVVIVAILSILFRIPFYVNIAGKMPSTSMYGKVYEIIIGGIILTLVPAVFLIAMNGKLVYTVLQAKRRRRLLASGQTVVGGSNMSLEMSITCNVIIVVFFFLVCNFLRFFFFVWFYDFAYWGSMMFDKSTEPAVTFVIIPVTEVICAMNYSINFFIYIIFFSSFRDQFVRIFCPCYKADKSRSIPMNHISKGDTSHTNTKETTLSATSRSDSRMSLIHSRSDHSVVNA